MFVPVCVLVCMFLRADFMLTCNLLLSADGQEEQHANTSANYDVELLHHRDAHLEFFKSGEY